MAKEDNEIRKAWMVKNKKQIIKWRGNQKPERK